MTIYKHSFFNKTWLHLVLSIFMITMAGSATAAPSTTTAIQPNSKAWFNLPFTTENVLLADIRQALVTGKALSVPTTTLIPFNPSISQVNVTLFQAGQKPLRWLSKRENLEVTLNRIVTKLRTHKRFKNFTVMNPSTTRILLEVVIAEKKIDPRKLSFTAFIPTRFEPGITGLKLVHNETKKPLFYMPTDAAVYSHMSRKQVFNHLAKKTHIRKVTNKISKRIQLLQAEPYRYSLLKSVAFITYNKDILPLYRSYPMPVEFSKDYMRETAIASTDWVLKNMDSSTGKFLYYYDGIRDTIVDRDHPNRKHDNLYYNSLRHSGGTITLLRMYELTKDKKYLTAAENSLKFIINNLRDHTFQGKKAQYLFYNTKSKLGGTGIALAAMVKHYQLTGDKQYFNEMATMSRHLLSRIDDDGELIGYYIHPLFNNGKPILTPTDAEKKQLFSFYYPGEALMGLALYTRYIPNAEKTVENIKPMSMKALDWLVKVRPKKYKDLFLPLPADGWLMQAIEEWSFYPDFQKKEYLNFVFNDAKQMIKHMYKHENSPYLDYPGGFYYHYGDHAYVDGARAEGLVAAYYLAVQQKEKAIAEDIYQHMQLAATSMLYTYNSPEATYMYKAPDKALGAFKFKYTRQWMRVDSVQHTACFFARFLMAPSMNN